MIQYPDYLTEELSRKSKQAVLGGEEESTESFHFLMGMRQGAFFASGMESTLYKKIDYAISEVINQREQNQREQRK